MAAVRNVHRGGEACGELRAEGSHPESAARDCPEAQSQQQVCTHAQVGFIGVEASHDGGAFDIRVKFDHARQQSLFRADGMWRLTFPKAVRENQLGILQSKYAEEKQLRAEAITNLRHAKRKLSEVEAERDLLAANAFGSRDCLQPLEQEVAAADAAAGAAQQASAAPPAAVGPKVGKRPRVLQKLTTLAPRQDLPSQ
eukprot:6072375-Pleurochrysis_carterae.AAC.1